MTSGHQSDSPWAVLHSRKLLILLATAAIAWGTFAAAQMAWTSDDAFISFRFARNLIEGHGLVFNPGERVEGYTNFLWTLWSALGLALDCSAESWANLWSLASFAACLIVLVLFHVRLRDHLGSKAFPLPAAALLGALHRDWQVYATSGLETSTFTLLLLLAYWIAINAKLEKRRLALAGLVAGLACLTRPEGAIVALVIGFFVLWKARARWASALAYAAPLAVIGAVFLAWKIHYYGDWLPNTYYAKSGGEAWYGQGWIYLKLYFLRYWPLLAGVVVVPPLLRITRNRRSERENGDAWFYSASLLALAIALVYTFYILRLGGDFMFARMLIPVAPFYLILGEFALNKISRLPIQLALLAILGAGMALTPMPVTGDQWKHGIADEWDYYNETRVAALEHKAEVLLLYLDGLPVSVAYLGAEARVAYQARIPTVIDCYGLTDRTIARLPLENRGRVGHEKLAPVEYLSGQRKVHFIFRSEADEILNLGDFIPVWPIQLAEIPGFVLHWDPKVMAELKNRGARFEEFPEYLDRYISEIQEKTPDQVQSDLAKFKLFYFNHVDDPERLAAIAGSPPK